MTNTECGSIKTSQICSCCSQTCKETMRFLRTRKHFVLSSVALCLHMKCWCIRVSPPQTADWLAVVLLGGISVDMKRCLIYSLTPACTNHVFILSSKKSQSLLPLSHRSALQSHDWVLNVFVNVCSGDLTSQIFILEYCTVVTATNTAIICIQTTTRSAPEDGDNKAERQKWTLDMLAHTHTHAHTHK